MTRSTPVPEEVYDAALRLLSRKGLYDFRGLDIDEVWTWRHRGRELPDPLDDIAIKCAAEDAVAVATTAGISRVVIP